jgi:hypothetical protein
MAFLSRIRAGSPLLTWSALGLGSRLLGRYRWRRCGRGGFRGLNGGSLNRHCFIIARTAGAAGAALKLPLTLTVVLPFIRTLMLALALTVILALGLAVALALLPLALIISLLRPVHVILRAEFVADALFQRAFGLAVIIILAVEAIVVAVAAKALLLFLPRTVVSENAEIMIRELQIIFGVDAVALRLGIARQILVFLKKLGGIAARAIVDAIARIAAPAITLRARIIPATTAAGLRIIDQR